MTTTAITPDYQILSQRAKLLAHPERLRLLDVLRRQPECVCHLEALLDKPQPYVSQQLRVLREGGLLAAEREGTNLYYRLADEEIGRWLDLILGPAAGEHPDLTRHKQIVSCECPRCDTGLEISFYADNVTSEIHMAKTKVIFLCTGNSARSQMAEGFLRHHAGGRFDPHSAGLDPQGIHPLTRQVMAEAGISLDTHESNSIRDYLGHVHFGYVITVCDHAEQNCPRAWLAGSNHLHWSFPDPAAAAGSDDEKLQTFRTVRDQIEAQILSWLATAAPSAST